MESDRLYVEHIRGAIAKIRQFVAGLSYGSFSINELAQSAVLRELSVIGEAAKKLSETFKQRHDSIPWKQIVGMRDKLIHDYFEIDVEAVWKTITEDLAFLDKEIAKYGN